MASNLGLIALSVTLGILFTLLGTIKLTPAISPDMHTEMKTIFKKSRKVFPLYKVLGWRPLTSEYRKAVGSLELVCGLVLMLIPGRIKVVANVTLVLLMFGAIYTHWALDEDLKHYTGALIFCLLLCCRLVIQFQVSTNRDDVRIREPVVPHEHKD